MPPARLPARVAPPSSPRASAHACRLRPPAATLLVAACLGALLSACGTPAPQNRDVKGEEYSSAQLVQSDTNRFANLIMRDNLDSLEVLLEKLYRRNPAMWRKQTQATDLESARALVMAAIRTGLPLDTLGDARGTDAIRLALSPDFEGDRAGGYVYGLGTMLLEAYNGRQSLTMIHGLDSQMLANAAHNVMVAAWLLADRKDAAGTPLLRSNELSADGRNLSFEREHGKIIGRLDTLAATIDEKYRRSVISYLQGLAAGPLLQFLPIDAMTTAVQ